MFICDECLEKHYEEAPSMFKSKGACEICKKTRICNEHHHSKLTPKVKAYITVSFGLRGYYAVLMGWYVDEYHPGGMWDVTNTSDPSFKEWKDAVAYAEFWAEMEGLECRCKNK